MKKSIYIVTAGLALTLLLSACGKSDSTTTQKVKEGPSQTVTKTTDKQNNSANIKLEDFTGTWITTVDSNEQNVTLDVSENKDGSYHFVYQNKGTKKEADYQVGKLNKDGYNPLTLKSGKDVFSGSNSNYLDGVTKNANGQLSIFGKEGTGMRTQRDIFVKKQVKVNGKLTDNMDVFLGQWQSVTSGTNEVYSLILSKNNYGIFHVEYDNVNGTNKKIGDYKIQPKQEGDQGVYLMPMNTNAPFKGYLLLVKDGKGNLQLLANDSVNGHGQQMMFKSPAANAK